jgi:hypothetical protein
VNRHQKKNDLAVAAVVVVIADAAVVGDDITFVVALSAVNGVAAGVVAIAIAVATVFVLW